MSNGLCIMFAFTCKGFFGCFLQALIKKIKVSGAGRPMKYELRSGMFAHEPKKFILIKIKILGEAGSVATPTVLNAQLWTVGLAGAA